MGKYFGQLIETETYNLWEKTRGALRMKDLGSHSPILTHMLSRYVIFSRVGDLQGTEFCVVRPYSTVKEDWDEEVTFLIKCI